MKDGREQGVMGCILMILIDLHTVWGTEFLTLLMDCWTTYQTLGRVLVCRDVRGISSFPKLIPIRLQGIEQVFLLTNPMHHLFECIAVQRFPCTVREPSLVHYRCKFLIPCLVMVLGETVVLFPQTWWDEYLNHCWEYLGIVCLRVHSDLLCIPI